MKHRHQRRHQHHRIRLFEQLSRTTFSGPRVKKLYDDSGRFARTFFAMSFMRRFQSRQINWWTLRHCSVSVCVSLCAVIARDWWDIYWL